MKLYKIGVIVGCLLLAGGSIKAQSVEDKALQELRADSSARTRFIARATMYGVGFTNYSTPTCHRRNTKALTSVFPAKVCA